MDAESKNFGRGPRELTGAVDLISRYKLLPHYEFFGRRSIPLAVADTHYLRNVAGDTEIRKGEGMQLNQLITDNTSHYRLVNTRINPFDVSILGKAFQLRETAPIDLSASDKSVPTIAEKSKSKNKDRERKHKRHKDKDRDKDKEHKKHKHRHKDRSKDKYKDKKKEQNGVHDLLADQTKKHQDKKRKHNGDEDINDVNSHKKSKHKSSRTDEMGAIRVAC